MKLPKISLKEMILIALMTAIISILAPFSISIPFSPVPITLGSMLIFISVYILGMLRGTLSYLLYLLIGVIGLPVFSGFQGGPGKLFGPTGGYLIGFLFMSLIGGFFIERFHQKHWVSFLGMLIGSIPCYLFGSTWLAFHLGIGFWAALSIGVLPYLAGDILKIICALIVGTQIRRALIRAGIL